MPAVGGFHDATAPARANDKAATLGRETLRPQRESTRELARVIVIATEGSLRRESCRAEEDDSVANARTAKTLQRREVLGEDTQRTGIVAIEEFLVAVGEWRVGRRSRIHPGSFASAKSM